MNQSRSGRRAASLGCFLILGGCFGKTDLTYQPAPQPPAGEMGPPAPAQGSPSAFTMPRDTVSLLPFAVRLGKLATVTGLPPGDPLLGSFAANRLQLGDADYANGVRPDRSWTAAKMALWVKLLKPLCASSAMQSRYALPADLSKLVQTAYGRRATPEDATSIDEALAGVALTGAEKQDVVCLSVLSSAEFVSR